MTIYQDPIVSTQMLIRKPVNEVFNAFIDPSITTKFWFTKSSGLVKQGKELRWDWEMFGASGMVNVIAVEQNKRILIEWNNPPCPVEWSFTSRSDNTTLVSISASGFRGTTEEIVAQALDSKGGFTMVLAGLKAYLEHGIQLNLVGDHFPDAHV